jgi:hypothetical protein
MKVKMPSVIDCEATQCAYNKNRICHAIAVNVGGPTDVCPNCDTFFQTQMKGGVDAVVGGVGACKVRDCKFNQSFECSAKGINMKAHENHVDCSTYSAR